MQLDISEIIDTKSGIEFRIADIMKNYSSIRYGVQAIPQRFVCLVRLRFNVVTPVENISIGVAGLDEERDISVAGCLVGVVVDLDSLYSVLGEIV